MDNTTTSKIENFILTNKIKSGDLPTDDQINEIANIWHTYISKTDPIRGLHCKKDFMMGFIIAGKMWNKSNEEG